MLKQNLTPEKDIIGLHDLTVSIFKVKSIGLKSVKIDFQFKFTEKLKGIVHAYFKNILLETDLLLKSSYSNLLGHTVSYY